MRHFIYIVSAQPAEIWYQDMLEVNLLSHPGGVYDSYPLSTIETKDKHLLYAP